MQTNGRREAAGNEAGPVSMSVPMRVTVTVDPEVQEAMVNKFAGLILEAHQEDCLWRRRACDGKSFFYLCPCSLYYILTDHRIAIASSTFESPGRALLSPSTIR